MSELPYFSWANLDLLKYSDFPDEGAFFERSLEFLAHLLSCNEHGVDSKSFVGISVSNSKLCSSNGI